MIATTILLTMFLQRPEVQTVTELFDLLDTNSDGKVTVTEISESQKPYFQRALRVSDQNEDGALTRNELTRALTDPKPVTVDTSGQRKTPNPESFDRNKDGYLSKSEIPKVLHDRFKRAFDQYGDRIPVRVIQDFRAGQQPSVKRSVTDTKIEKSDSMQTSAISEKRRRILEAIKRFDTNHDGSLNPREMRNVPQGLKTLDRNGDGEISRVELAGFSSVPEIRSEPRTMADRLQAAGRKTAQRMVTAAPEKFFERLDENGDGQLSGDEVPQRMRSAARRADVNADKKISLQEFRQILEAQNLAK